MREHALEEVMLGVLGTSEFDVLVCTTIVESGIDISNANTLIVDRADLLRAVPAAPAARAGSAAARERAYAYFLYPPEKPLTETAHDRLATIAQHTDLGAGMAGRDEGPRDPRRRQPARRRAVRPHRRGRLRPLRPAGRRGGRGVQGRPGGRGAALEVKVELPVDAHLPHDYIPGERLRLEAYRRLASTQSTRPACSRVREELRDRYGELPAEVENLLAVAVVPGPCPHVRRHRGRRRRATTSGSRR